jgi:hypothetical protein
MIYLLKKSTNYIIGTFDTITLANDYLNSIGIMTYEDFSYLMRINEMKYISRICYVDDVCIYNNKTFWLTQGQNIYQTFDAHAVYDVFGSIIYKDRFKIELDNNSMRLNNIYTKADEVAYNMLIGNEFISLFREECINSDLGSLNGLDIAVKTANIIPLIMTGSFKEALTVLKTLTTDEYFTNERLTKYKAMIGAADVIVYV